MCNFDSKTLLDGEEGAFDMVLNLLGTFSHVKSNHQVGSWHHVPQLLPFFNRRFTLSHGGHMETLCASYTIKWMLS